MKFLVSILCLNNLALTKRCLESVMANSGLDFEVLVTDNGSTDGTKEYLESLMGLNSEVTVVRHEKNTGFIEPNRRALKMAVDLGSEYLVLLNNDCVVPAGWLDELEAPFKKFTRAALSGPDEGCCSLHPNFHGYRGTAFEYLQGSVLCCKVSVMEKIGFIAPELVGAYGEDSYLSLRCRELGYTLHKASLHVPHVGSATSAMVPQVREWQSKNHLWLERRFAHYLSVRKFDFPIILRRADAWGDVLLLTPIIRKLAEERPLSPIYVETNCTDVFRDNPFVVRAERKIGLIPYALNIQLNMSYEALTQISIVDAYAKFVGNALGCSFVVNDTRPDISIDEDCADQLLDYPLMTDKVVAIHPGPVCWRSKEWGIEKFDKLAREMAKDGWKVVLVGSQKTAPCAHCVDLRGQTNIHQLAAVIHRANLFIGLDSFPLHVASAVNTPSIGLFGVTSSKFILTGNRSVGINSDAESAGLRHRMLNSREVDDGGAAMSHITVERVLAKVQDVMTAEVIK